MNSQNILKYYGSKIDLKLDNSEFYDLELTGVDNDYNSQLLDISTEIIYDSLIIDSICLSGSTQPFVFIINSNFTGSTCDFTVRRRTEKGWTLDFIFDKTNIDWEDGNVFYYLGISGETVANNYLDNNLSFSFTNDAKIKWSSVRYSGYCDNEYTTTNYISTGQTLNSISGITNDIFNLTITFDRYFDYYDCDLLNEGGQNDLVTGWTVENIYGVISGETEQYEIIETLNEKWVNERNKRLGILKFYINGKRVYSLNDWEEIIPSNRESSNEIVQVWGGGTLISGNQHSWDTIFNLINFYYYETPLNFIEVNHNYLTKIEPYYNTKIDSCVSDVYGYTTSGILTENSDLIITEDNNIITF